MCLLLKDKGWSVQFVVLAVGESRASAKGAAIPLCTCKTRTATAVIASILILSRPERFSGTTPSPRLASQSGMRSTHLASGRGLNPLCQPHHPHPSPRVPGGPSAGGRGASGLRAQESGAREPPRSPRSRWTRSHSGRPWRRSTQSPSRGQPPAPRSTAGPGPCRC